MLKAGLLGLGTIGKTHKRTYDKIAENNGPVIIEAYFDVSEEAFADVGDARTYTDIDAFLEGEKGKLDYIDICLPTFMHRDIAVKAMRMGFNVICEKPMALNYEQAKEMCDVAEETGKTLMIAHVLRFSNFHKMMYDCVKSGELGKAKNVSLVGNRSGLPMGANGWFRKDELSGGPVLDVSVHDVDLIQWFFGTPKEVSAIGSKINTTTAYDTISANWIYEDGMYVSVNVNYAIVGDEYDNPRMLRINFEKGHVITNKDVMVKVDVDKIIEDYADKGNNIFYDQLLYFANCIANNAPVDKCPPRQSAETIRMICAQFESADKNGEKVIM